MSPQRDPISSDSKSIRTTCWRVMTLSHYSGVPLRTSLNNFIYMRLIPDPITRESLTLMGTNARQESTQGRRKGTLPFMHVVRSGFYHSTYVYYCPSLAVVFVQL